MEETLRQAKHDGLRVVFYGPESTGKSSLAEALAREQDCPWVLEYMRTYLEDRGPVLGTLVSREELLQIARGQIQEENRVLETRPQLVVCDTNLLELLVYSRYYFHGWVPDELEDAISAMSYDHYFLTATDWPWVADNLRDRPDDRENMFRIFEQELTSRKLPYTILSGSYQERLNRAVQIVNRLKTTPNA